MHKTLCSLLNYRISTGPDTGSGKYCLGKDSQTNIILPHIKRWFATGISVSPSEIMNIYVFSSAQVQPTNQEWSAHSTIFILLLWSTNRHYSHKHCPVKEKKIQHDHSLADLLTTILWNHSRNNPAPLLSAKFHVYLFTQAMRIFSIFFFLFF